MRLALAREIPVFSIGANRKLTELPKGKSPLKLSAGKNIFGSFMTEDL
jgi:hypothetical protein